MFRKCCMLILFLLTNLGYCNLESQIDQLQELDGTIDKILENQDSLVLGVFNDRIYLKSERIFLTEQGLIAYSHTGETIFLPMLFSDSTGCFIQQIRENTFWCGKCGKYRLVNSRGKCRSCGSKIAPSE